MTTQEVRDYVKTLLESRLERIDKLEPMFNDISSAMEGLTVGGRPVEVVWRAYGPPDINVDLHPNEMHEAEPVIQALKAMDFHIDMPTDIPENRLRTFHAHRDGTYVTVFLFIADDGPCRAIETGKFTPVLKFVCPGDADYPTEEI